MKESHKHALTEYDTAHEGKQEDQVSGSGRLGAEIYRASWRQSPPGHHGGEASLRQVE